MTANSPDEMNVPLQQPGSMKNETSGPFGGKGKCNLACEANGERKGSRSHHTIKQSIITRHHHYAHESNT